MHADDSEPGPTSGAIHSGGFSCTYQCFYSDQTLRGRLAFEATSNDRAPVFADLT